MKKLIACVATFLATIGLVVASGLPANAEPLLTAGGHNQDSVEQVTVGTYIQISYACQDSNLTPDASVETTHWLSELNLPQGLEATSDFTIQGTPLVAGLYSVPDLQCNFFSPSESYSARVYAGTINIQPDPASILVDTSTITAGGHNAESTETVFANSYISINYGCRDDNEQSVNTVTTIGGWNQSSLPSGLSFNGQTLSGSTLDVGTFDLPSLSCLVEANGQSELVTVYPGQLIVQEAPPITVDTSGVTASG